MSIVAGYPPEGRDRAVLVRHAPVPVIVVPRAAAAELADQ
jgi:hypothetical protein